MHAHGKPLLLEPGMMRARVVAGLMHFVLRGKTHSLLMLSPSQMPLRDALNERRSLCVCVAGWLASRRQTEAKHIC